MKVIKSFSSPLLKCARRHVHPKLLIRLLILPFNDLSMLLGAWSDRTLKGERSRVETLRVGKAVIVSLVHP
jgi:hypothetical protein